jgi:hypothetical protein
MSQLRHNYSILDSLITYFSSLLFLIKRQVPQASLTRYLSLTRSGARAVIGEQRKKEEVIVLFLLLPRSRERENYPFVLLKETTPVLAPLIFLPN